MDISNIKLALALNGLQLEGGESLTYDGKHYAKLDPLGYDYRSLPEYLTKDNGTRYRYFAYGSSFEDAAIKVYKQWISKNST